MFSARKSGAPAGGYPISNSLRFQSASSQYLSRTFSSSPTSTTKQTFSFWVKRGSLSSTQTLFGGYDGTSGNPFEMDFVSSNAFAFYFGGASANNVTTTAVYRDPSAWYHIVVAVDTTQATASNRIKIYVNGNQVSNFSATNYPAQNANMQFGLANSNNKIGSWYSPTTYFDGYMAEVNFIDGQALTPSSFGETNTLTGQWIAKKYTGTYGTNGFYLPFSNGTSTTTLGYDNSGNGNNWTLTNFTRSAGVSDCWMKDVPSGNGGASGTQPNSNYAVMNPLKKPSAATYKNGNLTVDFGTNEFNPAQSTIYPVSGKWYWEAVWTSGTYARIGVQNTNVISTDFGNDNGGWRWESNTGNITTNNSAIITVSTYSVNDVLGFCMDCDTGKLYVAKNGVWQNSAVPESGTGAVVTNLPLATPLSPAGSTGYQPTTIAWNFGQRSFSFTPPSGYKALCTANL